MTTNDMTSGNPTKLILWFTLPLLIGNIFQQFYSLVDTLIVGRTIGISALAAVGSTGAVSWLIIGFVQGITTGFSVIIAQYFGASNYPYLRRSVTTSIILCIILTLFITAVSVVSARPLLELLNTPADIIEDAYKYIVIIYGGIGATVFYNMLSNIIRALGDSKTPLVFLIIASLINIILDLVFILNFHMGVAGAAWATVFSQILSGILCLFYASKKFPVLRLRKRDWIFTRKFVRDHLWLGLPMGLQMSVLTIGIIAVQAVLNSFGSITIAGFTAAVKVDQVATQFIISLGVTCATFTAQNYGAKNMHRIRTGVRKCLMFALLFSIMGGVFILTFGKFLTGLFISGHNEQVIALAQTYLHWTVPFYFALGILVVYRNTLQGMGNAIIPMYSGICELFMRIFAALVFGKIFGYAGVCAASPCAWVGAAVLLTFGYHKTVKTMTLTSRQKPLELRLKLSRE